MVTVWESAVDKGAYNVRVIRAEPVGREEPGYVGELIVERCAPNDGGMAASLEIHRERVGLSYGATFGPDVDDVEDWRDKSMAIIDADYTARGVKPPDTPV